MNKKLINIIILFDCLIDDYDCVLFINIINEYFDTDLNVCDYMEIIRLKEYHEVLPIYEYDKDYKIIKRRYDNECK